MELKTQLVSYCLTTIPPKYEKSAQGSRGELLHDALAAHALMQALERFDDAESIVRHADELLQEWTK